MERKNYYAIDIAKLISALFVVCIHTGPLLDINKDANFVLVQILARLAVPFFFVASGFLFFRKIDFKREWNDYENIKALRHYVGRLCKVYIIWTILYLPFTYLILRQGDGLTLTSLLRYVRDFFFNGSFYHLWFLPALMVSVPLVYLLISKWSMKVAMYTGCILYIIGMGVNVYGALLNKIPLVHEAVQGYLAVFSTARNGIFFGIIFVGLGAFFAKRRIYLKNYHIVIGLLFSLLCLFVECFLLRKHGFMKDLTSMYIMLIPCLFFLFLSLLRIHTKAHPACRTMRALSLLLYVTHVMFVTCILWMYPAMNSLLVYFLTIALSLVCSYVLLYASQKLPVLKHIYS